MSKKIIIVGAGLGGLASGLLLSKQGYKVEFVEKNKQAGGRLNQIKKDGFTFDTGPSFFSMSFVFKDFMDKCGVELPFKFVELDPLYSVNFSGDDKRYHLYKDIKKLSEQFSDLEPDFEIKMEKYLKKSKRLFDDTFDIVIRNNFDNNFDYAKKLMGVNPVHVPQLFNTFFNHVKSHFSSKEARSIISLVAFFLGRTPFDTMAIYSLLSHTEFRHDGYYNVEGGMYYIINGLVSELEKAGAVFHYDSEVVKLEKEGEKITKVIDNSGKAYEGDVFLINSDAALFRGEVLHREKFSEAKLEKMEWTMGYLTFYVGIKGKLDKLNLHNYFLGSNFEEYGRDVMHKPVALEKPYYYVNNVSKYNPDCAPEGCESLFFVCPVPNLQYKKDWSDKDDIVNSIIKDFSQRIGVDIMPNIITKTIYTPYDWEEQFNLFRGSGLGLSHQFTQIGALRPKNFDEEFKNLFYVGASTLPGAGLPMAVISAELATERILKALK